MNCQEVRELVQRELDSDLNRSEQLKLYGHLQQCPSCNEFFKRLQNLSEALEGLPKVAPPVSIVDMILPRLKELGYPGPEMETSQEDPPAAPSPSFASPKQWWRRMPVKTLGGVVAAGLVISLFIASSGPPVFEQASLDGANSGSSNQAASQVMISMETDNKGAKPDAEKSASFEATDIQPLTTERSSMESSSSPEKSGGQNVLPPTSLPEDQGVLQPVSPDGKPIVFGESGTITPFSITEESQKSPEKMEKPQSTERAAGTELATEDGKLIAFVKEGRIYVRDNNGETVYASSQSWGDAEEIRLLSWTADNRYLMYAITSGGKTVEFLLDLELKEENMKN